MDVVDTGQECVCACLHVKKKKKVTPHYQKQNNRLSEKIEAPAFCFHFENSHKPKAWYELCNALALPPGEWTGMASLFGSSRWGNWCRVEKLEPSSYLCPTKTDGWSQKLRMLRQTEINLDTNQAASVAGFPLIGLSRPHLLLNSLTSLESLWPSFLFAFFSLLQSFSFLSGTLSPSLLLPWGCSSFEWARRVWESVKGRGGGGECMPGSANRWREPALGLQCH